MSVVRNLFLMLFHILSTCTSCPYAVKRFLGLFAGLCHLITKQETGTVICSIEVSIRLQSTTVQDPFQNLYSPVKTNSVRFLLFFVKRNMR